ncbi:hypothetical protein K3495_g10071 [Podosphaera aphanis]|nr:hypothetical protein K3495_g10071 [Podosphaera aphanis]
METLLLTTAAVTTRTNEATLMFGGVASAIDEATRGVNSPALHSHLRIVYEEFLSLLQAVAQSFFDSHVRGTPVVQHQNGRTQIQDPQRATPAAHLPSHSATPPIPSSTRPNSYARAAASGRGIYTPPKTPHHNRSQQNRTQPNRLLSPYPLLLHYRKFLGENAALLKEVQHLPSGLALRPSSDTAAPRLEELFLDGIREGKLNGAIGIEKAQNLATYLISFVPRSYTALNDNNQLTKYPITSDLICNELKEEKGVTPVGIYEARTSLDSPHSHTARYIARFSLETYLPPKF